MKSMPGKKGLIPLVLVVCMMVVGCNKASDTSASSTNAMVAQLSAVNTTLTSLSARIAQDSNPTAFRWVPRVLRGLDQLLFPEAYATSGLSAIWTSSGLVSDLYSSSGGQAETLQNFMEQSMDPGFTNANGASTTVFGRFDMASMTACIIAAAADASDLDSDGLYKIGTYSKTIDFSKASGTSFMGCTLAPGMASQIASMGSMTMPLTVAATSTQTYYTKTYSLPDPNGNTMTIYLKMDTTNNVFNYLEEENSNPGGGGTGISRTILSVNGTKTNFEYISQAYGGTSNGYEFYRFYVDTGADVSYILGNYGYFSGATESYVRYTAAGKPSLIKAGTASIGLSVAYQNEGATSSNTNTGPNDACVSASSGNIGTDATLSCDTTGVEVSAATAVDTNHSNHSAGTSSYTVGETVTIPWTNTTDFFTAAASN